MNVFRDETGLATNPDLWHSITDAMDQARFFILLASPEAAASEWVDKEIEHWLDTHSADQILPVVTRGEIAWDAESHDIDWAMSTAAPERLRGVFAAEPRFLDLRWAHREHHLDLRNSAFRGAIADLAAPIHGLAKDELEGEDIRQFRHFQRLRRTVFAGLALLTILAVVGGVFAILNARRANRETARAEAQTQIAEDEAERANRQAAIAEARLLATESLALLDVDRDVSLLLAVESHGRLPTASAVNSIFSGLLLDNPATAARLVHGAGVSGFAVARGSSVVASVDTTNTIVLWDSATAEPLATHSAESMSELDISADGSALVLATTGPAASAAASGGQLRVLGAISGAERAAWETAGTAHDVALSHGGDLAALVDESGVTVYDVGTGIELARLGSGTVRWAVFGPALDQLTVGSEAGIDIFGARTLTPNRRIWSGNSTIVSDVAYSPEGDVLALETPQRSIFVDVASGSELLSHPIDDPSRSGVDPTSLTTAEWKSDSFDLIDSDGESSFDVMFSSTEVATLAAGSVAVAGMADGRVVFRSVERGQPFGVELARHGFGESAGASAFAVSLDGRLLASGDRAGVVSLWNATSGEELDSVQAHSSAVLDVAFSPDGAVLASAGAGGTALLWSLDDGRFAESDVLHSDADGVDGVAFSPDGELIAVALSSESLLLDATTHEEMATLTPGGQSPMVFSGDGRYLAGSSGLVWEAATGAPVAGPADSDVDGGGGLVAFSPDSSRMATGGASIREWHVATPAPAGDQIPAGPDITGPSTLLYSPDDRFLVWTVDDEITLWDRAAQRPLGRRFATHDEKIVGAGFAPTSDTLYTLDASGRIVAWELRVDAWRELACQIAGRNLTRMEWERFVGSEPYAETCPAR